MDDVLTGRSQVCDEDSSQNKALHFLSSYVGLRLGVCPEINHPKWNSFKRAVEYSGLQYDLMRLTIVANYGHGTKIGGERSSNRRDALKAYLAKQSDEWFEDISNEICLDRNICSDECGSEAACVMIEDFMDCASIRKRGDYVNLPSNYDL